MGRTWTAAVLVLCCVVASPAMAADLPVDLELALGVDVSRSVDWNEAQLQRNGYVAAFRDKEVISAIKNGVFGRIAVGYFEWASEVRLNVIVKWTLIDSEKSALALAQRLSQQLPNQASRTSISAAIDFATPWFDNNGFEGTRRVVDISGDGPNNWGDLVTNARARALKRGVTINGLPILDDGSNGGFYSRFNIPNLDLYYRDCVIGGPGAFIEVAADFTDFARAVRRKLILEIAGLTPPPARPRVWLAQTGAATRTAPPCDIGERLMKGIDFN